MLRQIRTITLVTAGAAIFAQGSLAAPEPKNDTPFNRPVQPRLSPTAARLHAQLVNEAQSGAGRLAGIAGDAGGSPPVQSGDAKNQLPFTRPEATPTPVLVIDGGGFSWLDGALGVTAGIGITLAGGAALVLSRKSPRTA
jgi:hypothetical protein